MQNVNSQISTCNIVKIGFIATLLMCCFQQALRADQQEEASLLRELKNKIAEEVEAGGYDLSNEAQSRLEKFLKQGIDELTSAPDSKEARKRLERAKKSCKKLAGELIKESRERSRDDRDIDLEEVVAVLRWICPLYPFC